MGIVTIGGRRKTSNAEGGTRTPTPFRAQRPERCVSTNFTTSAQALYYCIPCDLSRGFFASSLPSLHSFREHGIIHSIPWHHTLIRCLPLCLFVRQPLFLLDEYFLIALAYCLESKCKNNKLQCARPLISAAIQFISLSLAVSRMTWISSRTRWSWCA